MKQRSCQRHYCHSATTVLADSCGESSEYQPWAYLSWHSSLDSEQPSMHSTLCQLTFDCIVKMPVQQGLNNRHSWHPLLLAASCHRITNYDSCYIAWQSHLLLMLNDLWYYYVNRTLDSSSIIVSSCCGGHHCHPWCIKSILGQNDADKLVLLALNFDTFKGNVRVLKHVHAKHPSTKWWRQTGADTKFWHIQRKLERS